MAPDGAEDLCPEGPEGRVAADQSGQVEYMEDGDEDDSSATAAAAAKGRDNRRNVYDKVENFYLQKGAAAVSIMHLPLCVGEEIVNEGEGGAEEGLKEIYLVGQSISESREIRVLAEKWKLDLQPNSPPTFLVKTACGWLHVQKPKVAYRRIMTDGLTLAHFLHFARNHPSASGSKMREYLMNEFRQVGETPSLEKLDDFFPVIRRYMKADMEMGNSSILSEFFPGYFTDVIASCTPRDTKGISFQEEELPVNDYSTELNEEIPQELKHCEKQGVKGTSNSKTTKAHRASVNAELRNLHSQWCTLLGGRPTVKAEKKPASNRGRPSGRQSSGARKSERPKSVPKKLEGQNSVSSKPEGQSNVPKKGRPSAADRQMLQPKRRRSADSESPVSKKGLTSTPSLESKTSIWDQQGKSRPPAKVLNVHKSEENRTNMKRRKGEVKPAQGESAHRSPAPGRVMVGVRNASTDIYDRLEDPPICTICDDGGDLLCCEGPCQRHFHATPGKDTSCKTLGLTSELVKKTDIFYCKNCLLKQHQCFICQKLGSSVPSPLGPQEVYICDAPGCRKFYHAECVARVLDPELDWTAMAERIQRGLHGFLCPRHSCAVCAYKETQPGVFVQCRRCPKAWHRDCLTDFCFSAELPETSIWKHYDREFIYCKQHEILPHILTPAQDHVRFPKDIKGITPLE